jgi:hypothetical protein
LIRGARHPPLDGLRALYKQLIDAENCHDLAAVKPLVWTSPSTLFVVKTATAAEGNWAGFWGTETVMQHLHDLYQGTFRIDPDYSKEGRRADGRCRRDLRASKDHRRL